MCVCVCGGETRIGLRFVSSGCTLSAKCADMLVWQGRGVVELGYTAARGDEKLNRLNLGCLIRCNNAFYRHYSFFGGFYFFLVLVGGEKFKVKTFFQQAHRRGVYILVYTPGARV